MIAAVILMGTLELVAAPRAGAALDAFAGTCNANVQLSFSAPVTTMPTMTNVSISFLSGSCTLATRDNPVPHSTGLTVTGNFAAQGPTMTCGAGILIGSLRFGIVGDNYTVTAPLVNTDGVLAVSGSSGNFSAVGEFSRGVGACPSNGVWSATFVVEDPTIDGTF